MPGIARVGDNIEGMTTGEHHGHYPNGSPAHPTPCLLTGTITDGINGVLVNGMPIAIVGSNTEEDDCCGPGSGKIAKGSATVFVNGIPIARIGDEVNPHNGTASIKTGSTNVFAG